MVRGSMRQYYEEYFHGYDVPEKIKNIAISILCRFNIRGICDGMYICNVIGNINNIGDGEGNFWNDNVTKIEKTAEKLQSSYRSNIFVDDMDELKKILATGDLDKEMTLKGLERIISKCEKEKKECEDRRRDYLDNCIWNATITMQTFF